MKSNSFTRALIFVSISLLPLSSPQARAETIRPYLSESVIERGYQAGSDWQVQLNFASPRMNGPTFSAQSIQAGLIGLEFNSLPWKTTIGRFGTGFKFALVLPADQFQNQLRVPSEMNRAIRPGFTFRYHAEFSDNQLFIPTAAYNAHWLQYQMRDGDTGGFLIHGAALGFMIDLGLLQKSTARTLYKKSGISRYYLVLEAERLEGSNRRISADTAINLTAGLRIGF